MSTSTKRPHRNPWQVSLGLGQSAAQPVGVFASIGAVKPWETKATIPVDPSWMSFFLAFWSHALTRRIIESKWKCQGRITLTNGLFSYTKQCLLKDPEECLFLIKYHHVLWGEMIFLPKKSQLFQLSKPWSQVQRSSHHPSNSDVEPCLLPGQGIIQIWDKKPLSIDFWICLLAHLDECESFIQKNAAWWTIVQSHLYLETLHQGLFNQSCLASIKFYHNMCWISFAIYVGRICGLLLSRKFQ